MLSYISERLGYSYSGIKFLSNMKIENIISWNYTAVFIMTFTSKRQKLQKVMIVVLSHKFRGNRQHLNIMIRTWISRYILLRTQHAKLDLSAPVSVSGSFWLGSQQIFLKWPTCESTFPKFWFASVGAFKEFQKLLILRGDSKFFST